MPVIINIEKKSDQSAESVLLARTISGNFHISNRIKHAFQITLQSDDLDKSVVEQKTLLKQKIKELVKDFKKIKPISIDIKTDWNETYTENV